MLQKQHPNHPERNMTMLHKRGKIFLSSPSAILTNNHVNQSDYMLVPFISGIQCILLRYNVEITSKRMIFFRGGDAIMVNMYFHIFHLLNALFLSHAYLNR